MLSGSDLRLPRRTRRRSIGRDGDYRCETALLLVGERCGGVPYAVGVAVFGGLAQYVALAFKAAGVEAGFFWYVAGWR